MELESAAGEKDVWESFLDLMSAQPDLGQKVFNQFSTKFAAMSIFLD